MMDGITIKYPIKEFEKWEQAVNPSLFMSVGSFGNGDLKIKKRNDTTITTHRGKWETFDLIVKEATNEATGKQSFYLTIKGSLHKNHFGGKNYLPFTGQDLQEQVNHLKKNLHIDANKARISTLEIGLNICTPFNVTPFLRRNVICYKGKSFNRYKPDSKGICLGIYCTLTQYEIKIYDKGLQYDLSENLMRFELRFTKMQSLNNRGIKFLSDLQDLKKLSGLESLLINAWNNVLTFDLVGNLKDLPLKQSEIEILTNGKNPKFWEGLKETKTGDQYKYQKDKFKKLVEKFGNNSQSIVNDLLKNEWQNLFKNYPNLPTDKNHLLPDLTIKVKGKNREKDFILKGYCLSCNKELNPAQKINSKYCSAKYVGEPAAHQCRNNNSNPRNNFKNKIKRITGKGLLFDILPFIVNNNKKQCHAF